MSPNLKTLRKRMGFSVQEVAVRAEVLPETIVQIEDYDLCPSDELKEKVAHAIGFPISLIWPVA